MMHGAPRHRRRSLRLKGYDYSQAGAYFVTICTQDRMCLFGEVADGCMSLNGAGQMLATAWDALPTRFSGVELDAFVVMPNHVHGIIVLSDANPTSVGAPLVGARGGDAKRTATRATPTIGDVVGAFKSVTTVEYIRGVEAKEWPAFQARFWQRNYYEHVIRDERSLIRVRRYIDENPVRWDIDDENPQRLSSSAPAV